MNYEFRNLSHPLKSSLYINYTLYLVFALQDV